MIEASSTYHAYPGPSAIDSIADDDRRAGRAEQRAVNASMACRQYRRAHAASTMTTVPTSKNLQRLLCLDDFEAPARKRLPRPVFGFIAGAAETNWSFTDNRAAFAEYGFVPRVLIDASKPSQQTTLLGHTYAAPFGIAPLGLTALWAYRGDIALAAAAKAANIPMILSASSLIRLEDVVEQNENACRHQPYRFQW